ncbi:hypothetical protein LSAT2_013369 [Lamellibrachia satsuma]|nr:hypothetical protein LSAT2_013369 [Lamellibrachia satsuma]
MARSSNGNELDSTVDCEELVCGQSHFNDDGRLPHTVSSAWLRVLSRGQTEGGGVIQRYIPPGGPRGL